MSNYVDAVFNFYVECKKFKYTARVGIKNKTHYGCTRSFFCCVFVNDEYKWKMNTNFFVKKRICLNRLKIAYFRRSMPKFKAFSGGEFKRAFSVPWGYIPIIAWGISR